MLVQWGGSGMTEIKSIHDVAAMVGIDRKTSEEVLAEVKANSAKLNSCSRHDFSICLDRRTKETIADPKPEQRLFARWQCSKCGGRVDGTSKHWYQLGLSHSGNTTGSDAASAG